MLICGKMREQCTNATIAILMAVVGAALLFCLLAQPIHLFGMHTITVTATGYAKAVPAEVQIYMYANGTGASAGSAAANLSSTLSLLNDTLMRYVNGNESNITTDSYTITKVNETNMPYLAVEYLHVVVNTKKAGTLLGTLSNMSNVYINNEYVELSPAQGDRLKSTALSEAIANATSQARAIVGPNVVITPINITVSTYGGYPIYYSEGAGGATTLGVNLEFYPGTTEVTGTVTVIFSYNK